jgi:predicted nucleic acid-binding protein
MKQEERYTEENSFFFDSYALFEIIKGNSNYAKFKDSEIITTKLNLFELYHGFLKEKNEELARFCLDVYYKFAVDFDEDVIKEAAKMKAILNKRKLSMADCVGYVLSRQLGTKFLTGDEQFEFMKNVEFVK